MLICEAAMRTMCIRQTNKKKGGVLKSTKGRYTEGTDQGKGQRLSKKGKKKKSASHDMFGSSYLQCWHAHPLAMA